MALFPTPDDLEAMNMTMAEYRHASKLQEGQSDNPGLLQQCRQDKGGHAHFQKTILNWKKELCACVCWKCSGALLGGGTLRRSMSASMDRCSSLWR